jgi:hypothetical protein
MGRRQEADKQLTALRERAKREFVLCRRFTSRFSTRVSATRKCRSRGWTKPTRNHYGSRSKRGTEVAALFYSLCETAKLQNVEPRAYMLKAAYPAIENPGTIVLPTDLLADSAA